MKLIKLSDDPFIKILLRSVKLKWDVNRYWKTVYVDKDVYYIKDKQGNILYDNLDFEMLGKITERFAEEIV